MQRIWLAILLGYSFTVQAQVFYNSSTGADGALDLSKMDCTNCEIQLPESGVFNFTTVNIPSGKTLFFRKNSKNTPVFLLAQGKVTIAGSIDVSAGFIFLPKGDESGPGGYKSGGPGQPGFGPGGGKAGGDCRFACPVESYGKWVGPLSLVPIIGGSGGGYPSGGGGGGAIVIATPNTMEISGSINANGFFGGAGGAIRLVANAIDLSGGTSATSSGPNNDFWGIVRIEAPPNSVKISGGILYPAPVISPINPIIIPASFSYPTILIKSVAGVPVPPNSGQRFNTADIMLPAQLPDPLPIVVQASNIPAGTKVSAIFSGNYSVGYFPEYVAGTLTGTIQSSSATINISKLNRSAGYPTYVLLTATFDLPQVAQNFNPPGRDQVAQVRIDAPLGAKPKYAFLRRDGTEIDPSQLSPQFLQQFGNE